MSDDVVGRTNGEPKKEWRQPELRKLAVAATAGSNHVAHNDGNTKKVGSSGSMS